MDRFKFSLVSVAKRTFVKDDLVLDNMHFSGCEFVECNFLYSSAPTIMDNCGLRNCGWRIQGTAAIVVESLMKCGLADSSARRACFHAHCFLIRRKLTVECCGDSLCGQVQRPHGFLREEACSKRAYLDGGNSPHCRPLNNSVQLSTCGDSGFAARCSLPPHNGPR
jgi:hypothetical protein